AKEEAKRGPEAEGDELCEAADEIREKLCGASFDTCTILNGKSGRCGEDCKYCAQSAHHCTGIEEYPLLTADEITESRLANARLGVKRVSVVTSGLRLSDSEVDILCDAYSRLKKQTELELCTSNGLLTYEQFVRLRRAGVSTVHNNLETSRRYFPSICTTHTYEDKINTINAAKRAGMNICSGGIIGIGENVEDRIDLAFELCALGVKSIPINVLIATKGTALENLPPLSDEEVIRTAAIFRFINPKAYIRLAGGRKLLSDNGRKAFRSGLNASLVGNMLTSVGSSIDEDFKMIDELGFKM
ncbi:MAG: biotin synthase BioB, partial [Oscillospiraceae bacterium]|nr:biotin synthase BioB [Oscillospiraceae bacterium]